MTSNPQPKQNRQRSFNRRVMALFLSGAGLLIIATVAMILLPRITSTSAQNNVEEIDYQSAVPIEVDYPAPELDLVSLDGKAVSLRDFRGQVIQNFTVIAIEAGDQFEDVDYHVKSFEMTFPVWLDPYEKSLKAFKNFSLPSSSVIDAQGQVRLTWTGPITYEMLEKYVTPLLEE
jgi:hypothetical protein